MSEYDGECPICFGIITDDSYLKTKCNHIFCNFCLFRTGQDLIMFWNYKIRPGQFLGPQNFR